MAIFKVGCMVISKFYFSRTFFLSFFLSFIQIVLPLQQARSEWNSEIVDKAINQIYVQALSDNKHKEDVEALYKEWRSRREDLNDSHWSLRVYAEYGERIMALALDTKPELINKFAAQVLEGTIDKGVLPFFVSAFGQKCGYEDIGITTDDERAEIHIMHLSEKRALVICISSGVYNETADFLLFEKLGNEYKLSKYAPPGEMYEDLCMSNIEVKPDQNMLSFWPRPVSYVNGDGEVWKITNDGAFLIELKPVYGYLPIDKDIEKLTSTERLIYNVDRVSPTYALRRLDRMLNFIYKKAYLVSASKNTLKRQQRSWLKARTNTAEALKKAYEKRIWELLDNDALLSSLCDAILSGLFQDGDYFYDETKGYVDYEGERLGVIAHALYKKHYGSMHLPVFDFDAYHYSSMVKASENKVFIFWATTSEMREGNVSLHFVCMALERDVNGVITVQLVPFPGQPFINDIKPDGSTPGGYWGGLWGKGDILYLTTRQSGLWTSSKEKWKFAPDQKDWIRLGQ